MTNENFEKNMNQTKLQMVRLSRGLSQSKLAKASGVPLRTIQAYEVRFRQIEKAEIFVLVKLAKALRCKMTEIIDFY